MRGFLRTLMVVPVIGGVLLAAAPMAQAHRGPGDAFVGGLVGGMVGGIVEGAVMDAYGPPPPPQAGYGGYGGGYYGPPPY
ncbi:hypothetical protein [Novacetimonas maltaceti]|uniref:Glycine zipper domain-containing protein n=1 Tax=Novacetimonas maltaceti TaxID=1203393 RepID=A0A2S3W3I9_9PROT|nr:hypothetical protein [Novacetimonas maltaceti]POF63429.1 hypothetical protein KMAL_09850 [Novacetimonas maltaceti]